MGIRFVPNESIPPSVLRYLWPNERRNIIIRKHPFAFGLHALLLITILVIFGLDAAAVIKRRGLVLAFLFVLFVGLCLYVYRRIYIYLETYLCVTDNRLILIGWRRRRELTVIPIGNAADMIYQRTLLGRIMGYGTFVIRASEGRPKCKITYLPYPEQMYIEVCSFALPDPDEAPEPLETELS
jgi:hypothetical protein